jgi:hypothetical protein
MRALILALALFAAAKVWFQDNIYRSATEEALIAAYRIRAADACTRSTTATQASPSQEKQEKAVDWSAEAEPHVSVGNPAIPVHVWQLEHEQWNARFRQPYLILEASHTNLSCAYDLLAGTAAIIRS